MPVDGFGSDAGRQSLTAVGGGGVRARRGDACRTCGAYFAAGDRRCPSCGMPRQTVRGAHGRDAGATGPVPSVRVQENLRRTGALPPSSRAAVASGDAGRPDAGDATSPGASDPPSGASGALERERELVRPETNGSRGERLVAWSALGVLAVAAVFFVQRIGEVRDEPPSHAAAPSAAIAPDRSVPGVVQAPVDAGRFAPNGAGSTAASPDPGATAGSKVASHRARRPPPVAISAVRKPSRGTGIRTPSPAIPAAALAEEPGTEAALAPTRWGRMNEEIALCAPDGFFAKLICELDLRTRYCSGWWGSADECPSGRTADYGN